MSQHNRNLPQKLDCIIVGAGPAGLTAAEYLARFHRDVVVLGLNGPKPRLLYIDRTYNLPGYPQGVRGQDLRTRLVEQAKEMGAVIREETAVRIEGQDGDFRVQLNDGSTLCARKVILAMGVRDRHPDISNIEPHIGHFVRYCPVCDGYEHTGQNLGIVGSGGSVARHALFLQTFSNRITIFLHGESQETLGNYRSKLERKGIDFYEPRIVKIIEKQPEDSSSPSNYVGCGICLEDGTEHSLSVLYSALGCDLPLEPVRHLGLDLDEDGYLLVNENQETNITGVYATGDLVSQINQISVAFGQAAIAAVRIHNVLDDE
jgi:thioredoxin reductase (NADPH)